MPITPAPSTAWRSAFKCPRCFEWAGGPNTALLPGLICARCELQLAFVTGAPTASLSGASNTAGATALTVASGGASFTIGMWIAVGAGAAAELVQASATGGATSIPIANTPLRIGHAAAETVNQVTALSAPYSSPVSGYLTGG